MLPSRSSLIFGKNNTSTHRQRFGADSEDDVGWWSNYLDLHTDAVNSFVMQTSGTIFVPLDNTTLTYTRLHSILLWTKGDVESAGWTLG